MRRRNISQQHQHPNFHPELHKKRIEYSKERQFSKLREYNGDVASYKWIQWRKDIKTVMMVVLMGFGIPFFVTNRIIPAILRSTIPIYKIPFALPYLGDKSMRYQFLRFWYDLPQNNARSKEIVESLHLQAYYPISDISYDVWNCPFEPPLVYPNSWPASDLLENWPINKATPRDFNIYQSICRFDYETELEKILNYRSKEIPFVVRGDPNVARTVERWHLPKYIDRLLGTTKHLTEVSNQSHFLYWSYPKAQKKRSDKAPMNAGMRRLPQGWIPPTHRVKMTYQEWLRLANRTIHKDDLLQNSQYYYFQVVGCGNATKCYEGSAEFLFDELPFFQPSKDQLYLVKPGKQRGINCRFGFPSLSLAAHFDSSRNSIVILSGSRRYILAHPKECSNLALYPQNHPSARHSSLNWDDSQDIPAHVHEVVLQAGDVLYLPPHWFHMIVSLDMNIQCNIRSGYNSKYAHYIRECGQTP